ncbi:hypothetical protein OSB04_un000978 [Centaurea solstitialis]|uniref:UBN2_2 domain-containing protein n=1 Tax=Centaurea solstitialis TaxID=347529 RepID=A0AA38W324_9ASTR|nr:hypothetical protein OSB04_un000978 [Centaurea solstitialis]
MKVVYVLDPDLSELPKTTDDDAVARMAERKKRGEDEFLCREYILNSFTDRLYDLYSQLKSTKEIWKALEHKYDTEKQGADKFIAFKLFEFSMSDNTSILDQVHEFLILISKFKNLNITIPDQLVVGGIIAKLPPSWNDYRKKLLHTTEDFTLEQLQKHLRIEEETRNREKDLNVANASIDIQKQQTWVKKRTEVHEKTNEKESEKANVVEEKDYNEIIVGLCV